MGWPDRARPRAWRPAAVLAGLLLAASWLASGAAGVAPDEERGGATTSPGPGRQVAAPPEQVELRLDRAVGDASVSVTGPDDRDLARGRPTPTSEGISQRVAPAREPGAYQVAYRVRTTDGAVTTGSHWFVYSPAGLTQQRLAIGAGALAGLAGLVALVARLLVRRSQPRLHEEAPAPGPDVPGSGPEPPPAPPRLPRQRRPSDGPTAPPRRRSRRATDADVSSEKSLGTPD